jgi:ATP-dependent Clp protease adaptor protein ClpS
MAGDPALSNPKGLINLGRIVEPGGWAAADWIRTVFACLRRASGGPIFPTSIQRKGRIGRERRSENVRELVEMGHPVVVQFPVGMSNACAMLQLTSRFDGSVSSAAVSAVRMSNDENRTGGPGGPATSVIAKVKPKTKRPNLYRVLILNDDYTPMEFVVHVLEKFFQKDIEAATKIMLHVHHHGIGECGVFTYEIAETKVTQVMDFARKHQHPLQCVMEKK